MAFAFLRTSGEGMPQHRPAGRVIDGRSVRRMKLLYVALLGASTALAVCGASSAACAGDDDVASKESVGDKILDTLGLKNPFATQYEINYSERSPLVVPPDRSLPPPQSAKGPPAPGWPVDPEVTRRAAAQQAEKVRPHPDYASDLARPLRPGELNATNVNAPGTNDQSTPSERGEHRASLLNFDWLKQEDYGTFTGEPPRVSLTDPPPGYQTPSADQPYGVTPERKIYKPPTVADRVEPHD